MTAIPLLGGSVMRLVFGHLTDLIGAKRTGVIGLLVTVLPLLGRQSLGLLRAPFRKNCRSRPSRAGTVDWRHWFRRTRQVWRSFRWSRSETPCRKHSPAEDGGAVKTAVLTQSQSSLR